jgi:thioredoxin reductase (NADPH)
MHKALILAVESDAAARQILEKLLRDRYGISYTVLCAQSPAAALQHLAGRHSTGEPVAVLLAAHDLPEMPGIEFFAQAHNLYPYAKRLLLFDRKDEGSYGLGTQAMQLGQVDYLSLKPSGEPDEAFHLIITEFLVEWTGIHQETFKIAQIIGDQWDPKAHRFRDLFERNRLPYGFYARESDTAEHLLQQVQRPAGPFPLIVLYTGAVLADPSVEEVADTLGASTYAPHGVYDLTIVGGGPAGLTAGVYGASEGLRTLVIERLALGGQAGTSSRIRNYPGFPRGISGGELAGRIVTQAALLGTHFQLIRSATGLGDGGEHYLVTLSDGTQVASRTVVLAMGVAYRRLGVPTLEALTGAGVYYGASLSEAQAMQGQDVFVVGGGNSAGQAAIHLAQYATHVTMIVRGEGLAASMSEYLIKEIDEKRNIAVRTHAQVINGWGDVRLQGVLLQDTQTGRTEQAAAAGLFVLIGAEPNTAWLPAAIQRDTKGYILTGQDLVQAGQPPDGWPRGRLPLLMETSLPRVFAIGDVRHDSVKRVASAVGEGSIVVHLVHQVLGEP